MSLLSLTSPLALDLAAVRALAVRDALRFWRDRSQILGAVGRPAIWMLLFGSGLRPAIGSGLQGGIDYRQFTYAGAIAMTILFAGMFQGITVVWDREFGMLRAVLVAPVSRTAIVIGKTCAGGMVTLFQALIAAAFAPLVDVSFSLEAGLLLFLAMAALSLSVTAIGVAIGSRMRTFEGFGIVSNFVVLPLYFLSGGIFPVQGLPPWMQLAVRINPVTYAVDSMRAAVGQPHLFAASVDAGVLLACLLVACAAALLAFRRVAH